MTAKTAKKPRRETSERKTWWEKSKGWVADIIVAIVDMFFG